MTPQRVGNEGDMYPTMHITIKITGPGSFA